MYVEVRISRSIFEGPFDLEITRVDFIFVVLYTKQCHFLIENISSLDFMCTRRFNKFLTYYLVILTMLFTAGT